MACRHPRWMKGRWPPASAEGGGVKPRGGQSLRGAPASLQVSRPAASHVVHFDRWWNPAVEDQATDRAFRIGQVKNVLVHKLVCRGTIEDKIDQMVESKQQLSRDLLSGGAEILLTEMADEELLSLVALDLNAARAEA